MIGIPLAHLVPPARIQGAWSLYPLLVTFVVVATANHFVIDAVLGALAAGASAWAAHAPGPRPPAAWAFSPAGLAEHGLMARAGSQAAPGGRRSQGERRAPMRNRLIESRLTPNAISLTGLRAEPVAAVLVWKRASSSAGIAFIVGSIMDTLDGRYSRMSGKGTPFGAFLDSTLDRLEEGIVLAAVGAYFAARGD